MRELFLVGCRGVVTIFLLSTRAAARDPRVWRVNASDAQARDAAVLERDDHGVAQSDATSGNVAKSAKLRL